VDRRVSFAAQASLLALVALAGGCGSESLVPVKGKVTVDGAPLTTGSLVFKPDAAKGNASKFDSSSEISADGSYSLFTRQKEGAPPGWYKVGVVAQGPANPADPYSAQKSLIAERYNNPDASGLAVEVAASPPAGAYDLKLAK
jgi:hypothetical protein